MVKHGQRIPHILLAYSRHIKSCYAHLQTSKAFTRVALHGVLESLHILSDLVEHFYFSLDWRRPSLLRAYLRETDRWVDYSGLEEVAR